jgi:hypothetical protein
MIRKFFRDLAFLLINRDRLLDERNTLKFKKFGIKWMLRAPTASKSASLNF